MKSSAEERSILAIVPRQKEPTVGREIPHSCPLPPMANVAAILSEYGTGRFKLRGLTNGTVKVNGAAVDESEAEVREGDRLDVGAYVLELRRRIDRTSARAEAGDRIGELIAWSPAMRSVLARVRRVADSDLAVLLTGPTGSGKEVVARAVHDASPRKDGPFLALNCGALGASLIEGELFGHVKGAFTGATESHTGAFEACEGGTIFLDEIGELPLELQPKLLRVLEMRAIRRVGGTKELPVNVRVVAATHRNLRSLVAQGLFREDLYHRLRVLDVSVPPLKDRPEDILPFARHFLEGASSAERRRLSPDAEASLLAYPWPGNVRELRNVILRASVLSDRETIYAEDLELVAQDVEGLPTTLDVVGKIDASCEAPPTIRRQEQRETFIRVLRECRNNRAEAARRLGLSRSTFHAQLVRAGLSLKYDRE